LRRVDIQSSFTLPVFCAMAVERTGKKQRGQSHVEHNRPFKKVPPPLPSQETVQDYYRLSTTAGRLTKREKGEANRLSRRRVRHWERHVKSKPIVMDFNRHMSKQEAREVIEGMRNTKARTDSGYWVDKEGRPLVAYFANSDVKGHGLPQRLQEALHAAVQTLTAELKPGFPKETDSRHKGDYEDPMMEYMRENSETGDFTFDVESKAVLHLIHAWHPIAHYDDTDLVPSPDMLGLKTAAGQLAVCRFFSNTGEARNFIRETLKAVVDEEEFARFEQTFKAGRYVETDTHRPFLGVVCVYKCQVDVHRDSKDGCMCFITNFGTYREGGELYLPQLGLKLAYRPGDIVGLRSAELWHEVKEWIPEIGRSGDVLTPGRIGMVFMSQRSALDALDEKPEGWMLCRHA